ncbi:hypothetical protein H6F53_13310 [Trichocoleus sp. FACHB-832]|uniref:hypothetical protein n=1 Tax=Trichocoleus sp. FACHB-832 TaxID=2692875 RepID=UPI0016895E76|nr:hypothetical protein [Trichocoleus sp. FACHB-832]MBD1906456.1 hypothetical protein [Trichocoleus sp. FACHB-832]
MVDGFKAFPAVKAAIDWIKELKQYADEVKDTQKRGEFMRIIGELSIELAETQISFSEQLKENYDLKEEINALKKENDRLQNPNSKPIIRDGLYYVDDDGPFCTGCYDTKRSLVRVNKTPEPMQVLGKYKCPVCKTMYNGKDA